MTLQLLHSKFPFIYKENLIFFSISVPCHFEQCARPWSLRSGTLAMFSSLPSSPATKYTCRFSFFTFRVIIFHWCTLGIAMFKIIYKFFWSLLRLSKCSYDKYVNKITPTRIENTTYVSVSQLSANRSRKANMFFFLFKEWLVYVDRIH
jgi:hypothetical protein